MMQIRCPRCSTVMSVEGSPPAVACPSCQTTIAVAGAAPAHSASSGKAVASLVLGIVGLLAWLLPIIGLPVTIIGLVLGIGARRSPNSKMATAGIIMSLIGLVLTIANAAWGAYLGATGQLDFNF